MADLEKLKAEVAKLKVENEALRKTSAQENKWAREEAMRVTLAAFVKGLRPEISQQLQYFPPQSFSEAIEMAARVENAQRQSPFSCAVGSVKGVQCQEEASSASTLAVKKVGNCFQCSQSGHFARNCPQRKSQESATRRGIQRPVRSGNRVTQLTCFVCGQQGHFARDCARRATQAGVRACQCTNFLEEPASPKGNGPTGAPPAGPSRI